MPPLYVISVTSFALAGVLAVAPGLSAQEAAVEAVPHALSEETPSLEAAGAIPAVAAPVVAAAQRPRGNAGGERRTEPRRGDTDRNRRAGGAAPGRDRPNPPARRTEPDRNTRRGTVVIRPQVIYPRSTYYYGRPYIYSYGGPYLPSRRAFGLGIYYGPSHRYDGYYSGYYAGHGHVDYGRPYDIGELRLQVSPRHAQVFVDGDYAGTVDDFDGTFQSLKLESGSYAIRLEAPGFETMEFDVRITPQQKVTYREDLRRD